MWARQNDLRNWTPCWAGIRRSGLDPQHAPPWPGLDLVEAMSPAHQRAMPVERKQAEEHPAGLAAAPKRSRRRALLFLLAGALFLAWAAVLAWPLLTQLSTAKACEDAGGSYDLQRAFCDFERRHTAANFDSLTYWASIIDACIGVLLVVHGLACLRTRSAASQVPSDRGRLGLLRDAIGEDNPFLLWSAIWRAQIVHLLVFIVMPVVIACVQIVITLLFFPFAIIGSMGNGTIEPGKTITAHLAEPWCWVAGGPCSLTDTLHWPIRYIWLALWIGWVLWYAVRRQRKRNAMKTWNHRTG